MELQNLTLRSNDASYPLKKFPLKIIQRKMSRIGSSSYLFSSPYQIISTPKTIHSFSSHWVLIQLISSVINISTFGNSHGIFFSHENMVSNGWFKMYLNQYQYEFLTNSKFCELYPIRNKNKVKSSLANNLNWYIEASNDWIPPQGSKIVSRITQNLFRVHNLTITSDIKNDERILSIKRAPSKLHKNRYTSGFVQSNSQYSVYDHGIFAPLRSVHNLGLDGTGQVINIVDTGIDMYNPMFHDPDNSIDSISGKTNFNHRKVVRIEIYADDKDYFSGHGTHVCGIAAGSAFCGNSCGISQYNGIAPGAKLYVSDIGYATTPGDISEEFDPSEQAKLMNQYGSYISSNSWSYDDPGKEDIFKYDKAAYDNPNNVYLFAAGNDYRYFSINVPGACKNAVAVGATKRLSAATSPSLSTVFIEGTLDSKEFFKFEAKEKTPNQVWSKSISNPMEYLVNLSLIHYSQSSSISDLSNYVVYLDTTSASDLCSAYLDVSNRKAKAAIYYSGSSSSCSSLIPLIGHTLEKDKESILSMKKISILPYPGELDVSLPAIADLSSRGPSFNGISKPDFAVPGQLIISAKSNGMVQDGKVSTSFYDSLTVLSGTSMATPAGAGIMAIVRQFFIDGFYPSLQKNSQNSIVPSSCLMRAMVINSASFYSRKHQKEINYGYEFETGFGIPCLERVFGLRGSGLRVFDNIRMKSKSHHVYHIHLDSNENDLSVTMIYIDPPLNPDNDALFFADLNLIIKAPNGRYYVGNDVSSVSDTDSFSNIEKVSINQNDIGPSGGDYEIHIISNEYALDDEIVNYSVVVNGPFEQTDFEKNPIILSKSDSNQCINACNNHGTCGSNGLCVCNEGYIGAFCNTGINELHDGESDQFEYTHKHIRYYKVSPKQASPNMSLLKFSLSHTPVAGSVFVCASEDPQPGPITNAAWNCVQMGSRVSSSLFSVDISQKSTNKAIFVAVYTSYHNNIRVTIGDISFTDERIPDSSDDVNVKDKILFAAMIFLLVVITVCIVILLVLFCRKKRRKFIAKEESESVAPTVNLNTLQEINDPILDNNAL